MQVKWLVGDYSLPEDAQPMFDAMNKLGIEYKTMESRHKLLLDSDGPKYFDDNDCVVFYGSLEAAKILKRTKKWIPGVYCNLKAFECTSYYPVFGQNLLNHDYIMLPYGELSRRKEFIYDVLGSDRTIFIRPNVGDKIFTGKLVYKEHFDKDIKLLGFYDVPDNELVICASPYNISAEWRFVVVDNKIITGSLYKENNLVGSEICTDKKAEEFASEMAKLYSPDRVWTLDICKTKLGSYYLLEIGCFSCAGLYKCDRDKIVEAVSKVAIEEYDSYVLH